MIELTAVEKSINIFERIYIAAQRAKEIAKGDRPYVEGDNGPCITALREVNEGFVGREYLERIKQY